MATEIGIMASWMPKILKVFINQPGHMATGKLAQTKKRGA